MIVQIYQCKQCGELFHKLRMSKEFMLNQESHDCAKQIHGLADCVYQLDVHATVKTRPF